MNTYCDAKDSDHNPTDQVLHVFDVDHNHNRRCGARAGWEILREHPDFSHSIQAPQYNPNKDHNADLNFRCVRKNDILRIVLVMDVSGSMFGNRMDRMRADVRTFLMNLDEIGEPVEVGMVEFESSARVLANMTLLETEDDLNKLIDAIPTVANGGTCIGCGILSAINVSSPV